MNDMFTIVVEIPDFAKSSEPLIIFLKIEQYLR